MFEVALSQMPDMFSLIVNAQGATILIILSENQKIWSETTKSLTIPDICLTFSALALFLNSFISPVRHFRCCVPVNNPFFFTLRPISLDNNRLYSHMDSIDFVL